MNLPLPMGRVLMPSWLVPPIVLPIVFVIVILGYAIYRIYS